MIPYFPHLYPPKHRSGGPASMNRSKCCFHWCLFSKALSCCLWSEWERVGSHHLRQHWSSVMSASPQNNLQTWSSQQSPYQKPSCCLLKEQRDFPPAMTGSERARASDAHTPADAKKCKEFNSITSFNLIGCFTGF